MQIAFRTEHFAVDAYLDAWDEILTTYNDLGWEVDGKRQVWVGRDAELERKLEVRPPLPFPALSEGLDLDEYLDQFNPDHIPSFGMFLLQAGAGALGYFEDGEVLFHKAIKKYMVRAKRGKAQLTYLNTRGKSKAGSRIRLANTARFVEEVTGYIRQWEEYDPPAFWLYSCPATLWGLLFAADPPPPFSKQDSRLRKLPFDVHKPDFEEVKRIGVMACQAEFRFYLP